MRSPVCDKWTLVLNQNPVIIVDGCHGVNSSVASLEALTLLRSAWQIVSSRLVNEWWLRPCSCWAFRGAESRASDFPRRRRLSWH